MEKARTIRNIIFIPNIFFKDKNVSFYSLLKESGYFQLHNKIGETDIYYELIKHLECIDQWLVWSENKRIGSGWYFSEIENGKYNVGYFSRQEKLKPIEYVDKIEACSAFIKREIEDVRCNT